MIAEGAALRVRQLVKIEVVEHGKQFKIVREQNVNVIAMMIQN